MENYMTELDSIFPPEVTPTFVLGINWLEIAEVIKCWKDLGIRIVNPYDNENV